MNDSDADYENNTLIVKNDKFILHILKDTKGEFETNDDKIIETGCQIDNIIFISNDIIFRTKCLLKGKKAQSLKQNQFNPDINFIQEVEYNDCFPNKEFFVKQELENLLDIEIQNHISYLKVTEYTGKPFYLLRQSETMFQKINLDEKKNLFGVRSKNLEQKLLFNLMLDDNDIVVVDAIAGTGKTLSALVCALKLIEQGKFNKITYIRKTIISGDKFDEIGFLPGSKEEKIMHYLYPLKDNIEFIVKNKNKKKKKWTLEEIEEAVKNFENQYNINYEYTGHLRGRNLDGIIILDESQNFSIKDLTFIISRIRQNSKVFIIGSTKQIDNPILNKYNNALTFMLNHCGDFDDLSVRGFKMSKVERGKITEWIENITQ